MATAKKQRAAPPEPKLCDLHITIQVNEASPVPVIEQAGRALKDFVRELMIEASGGTAVSQLGEKTYNGNFVTWSMD